MSDPSVANVDPVATNIHIVHHAGKLLALAARLDLEGASGVGRLHVVQTFFDGDDRLKPPTTQAQMSAGFAWA